MLELLKGLLEVAKALVGLSDGIKTASRERRAGMATLFEQIGVCLTGISNELRSGGASHGKCSELRTYAEALPDAIRREVGDAKANELSGVLDSAYSSRAFAAEVGNVVDKGPYLKALD